MKIVAASKPKSRVQSATRALRLLEYLNAYPGTALRQLAQALDLSRGTTYRLLETLCDDGYLERDQVTGGYRPAARVRSLSDGFADEQWLRDYAIDRLAKLADEINWPLKLTTLNGFEMLVRASTDLRSPFAFRRTFPGHRVSLINSAAGMVYLAYATDDRRRLLINTIRNAMPDSQDAELAAAPDFPRKLEQIRADGYGFIPSQPISMVAVPIQTSAGVFGCVVMQYYTSAVKRRMVIEGLVPKLAQAARDIAAYLDTSGDGERTNARSPNQA